jgi:hypothetical protein
MAYKPIDPLDALCNAMSYSLISSHDLRKPGAVIQRMSPGNREALERLTSGELAKARVNTKDFCETDAERLARWVKR